MTLPVGSFETVTVAISCYQQKYPSLKSIVITRIFEIQLLRIENRQFKLFYLFSINKERIRVKI